MINLLEFILLTVQFILICEVTSNVQNIPSTRNTRILPMSNVYVPEQIDVNLKIVGGSYAVEGQFPHQIAIKYRGSFQCGGSIYNKNFIITAAHCVFDPYTGRLGDPKDYSIVVGTLYLNISGSDLPVKKLHPHEGYGNFQHDIALIELVDTLTLINGTVQPIKLRKTELPEDSNVTISGWGRTSHNGPLPNQLKYNTVIANDGSYCSFISYIFTSDLLCMQHAANNGACNGDSGGPAMYNGELVGVANFIINSCGTSLPDGYAKVSSHVSWIEKNAGSSDIY